MVDLLHRLLGRFRRRNVASMDGMPANRWRPRAAALAEVERAVAAGNAAEVERVTRLRLNNPAGRSDAET